MQNQIRRTYHNCPIGLARLDDISETDNPEHYCGLFNQICTCCRSRNFEGEKTGPNAQDRKKFSPCCEKWKVTWLYQKESKKISVLKSMITWKNIYRFIDGQHKSYIFFQVKKAHHGGKRKGAGRPPEGKKAYLVTLTEKNAEKAKKREANFSALLDRLLARWVRRLWFEPFLSLA